MPMVCPGSARARVLVEAAVVGAARLVKVSRSGSVLGGIGADRRRRWLAFWLVFLLGASVALVVLARSAEAAETDPLPREATAAAGALGASHAVTQSGQATYTVPIEAPPGIAGLLPSIALAYSSGGQDGIAGEGWEVTGFSVIERCALSSAQSGGFARPIEDPAGRADAFCLDGQLLVVVAGTYGADGSEYRTEVDSHTKVVLSRPGGAAAGPEGFEARRKDGRILRYGFATDAVTSQDSIKRRWAVKEEQDRNGNYLEMVYGRACTPPDPTVPTCTRYAPSEVRYGGHRSSGTGARAHDRAVRFVYEDRADGWSAFRRGLRDLEWRRLNRIETVVGGVVVRRYKLEYDTRTDISRLLRLRECVDDPGAEVCKPPTEFTYDNAQGFSTTATNAHVVPLIFGNGLGSLAVGRTIVLDANGDGMDDLRVPGAERAVHVCAGPQQLQRRLDVSARDRYRQPERPVHGPGHRPRFADVAGHDVLVHLAGQRRRLQRRPPRRSGQHVRRPHARTGCWCPTAPGSREDRILDPANSLTRSGSPISTATRSPTCSSAGAPRWCCTATGVLARAMTPRGRCRTTATRAVRR